MITSKTRGFTLIELLVTLVIISLFLSMAVISVGDSLQRDMRAEIERLQSVFIAMSDDAVYSDKQFGLYMTKNGYAVVEYDTFSASWLKPVKKLYLPYFLPESMRIEWTVEGFSSPDADEGPVDFQFGADNEKASSNILSASNNNDEDGLQDQREEADFSPQVYALSSGEMTVFTITFRPHSDIRSDVAFELVSDGFSMPKVRSLTADSSDSFGLSDERF